VLTAPSFSSFLFIYFQKRRRVKCVGTVGTFVSFADETSEDEKREAREETLGPFPSLSLSLFLSLSTYQCPLCILRCIFRSSFLVLCLSFRLSFLLSFCPSFFLTLTRHWRTHTAVLYIVVQAVEALGFLILSHGSSEPSIVGFYFLRFA
jgi:hypothetical protein